MNAESEGKKNPWAGIALLTVLFVGTYFGLRALPDAQCGFLHYVEVVHPDGTIEFCATTHAGFLDLSRLDYPVKVELGPLDAPRSKEALTPDQPVRMALDLYTKGGMPIAPHELAITHTEKMHVMLIDDSFEDYQHLHPQPEGIGGRYVFEFMPRRGGEYRVFTEIVPVKTRRQVIGTSTLTADGTAAEPQFERRTTNRVDGLHFELEGVPERLRRGVDHRFDLKVRTADGAPVTLEEIMGAKGHLVAFDAARKGFAHMHPADNIVPRGAGFASTAPVADSEELSFYFNVPNPGWYRLFAQVRVDGREVFGRFDLLVE